MHPANRWKFSQACGRWHVYRTWILTRTGVRWDSSTVEHRANNTSVAGSNPAPNRANDPFDCCGQSPIGPRETSGCPAGSPRPLLRQMTRRNPARAGLRGGIQTAEVLANSTQHALKHADTVSGAFLAASSRSVRARPLFRAGSIPMAGAHRKGDGDSSHAPHRKCGCVIRLFPKG